ncbi:MAG: SDR family NAD(P)-dependent oxidoreductase [Steroidobacterales bacterium]
MGSVSARPRGGFVKRVLLTGASAGFGLQTARALCERGHEVWGTSRDVGRLPVVERFHPVALDLNDPASIEAGFAQALQEAGYFDVLINNAGAGVFGPVEAFSDAEFAAQLQMLVLGPQRLICGVLPDMRARHAGLIVNVSSLAGEFPMPFMIPYSMGKAALSAMSEGLVMELAGSGIEVVDVRPGDFRTRFHESTRRIGGALDEAYRPGVDKAWTTIDVNMNRAPNPQQVADALVRIVEGRLRGPIVALGDAFQARIAPFLVRLVPRAWVQWGMCVYYGLKPPR